MISRFRTRSGLLTEELDGALIVVDVQAGKVHELNSTAAWLWARLDHWVDAGELTETLCQHYDISTETAQKDVKMILDQLHNRGLLIENQT